MLNMLQISPILSAPCLLDFVFTSKYSFGVRTVYAKYVFLFHLNLYNSGMLFTVFLIFAVFQERKKK